MIEKCENCGQVIGALETAHVWNDRVVCAPCKAKLSQTVEYATASPPAAQAVGATRVTTIEQTAKRWKAQLLLSALMIVTGFVFLFVSVGLDARGLAAVGMLMIASGVVWWLIVRVLAWWHHG